MNEITQTPGGFITLHLDGVTVTLHPEQVASVVSLWLTRHAVPFTTCGEIKAALEYDLNPTFN